MTLAMDEETHTRMKKRAEIRWSEVARKAIKKKLEEIEIAQRIAEKSRLSQKDVEEFAKKIKASAARRFANEDGQR